MFEHAYAHQIKVTGVCVGIMFLQIDNITTVQTFQLFFTKFLYGGENMRPEWTGEIVKKMHIYNVTNRDLAEHIGISETYLCSVLNGKRNNKRAEHDFNTALDELIAQRIV